jgi:hypothetical protein
VRPLISILSSSGQCPHNSMGYWRLSGSKKDVFIVPTNHIFSSPVTAVNYSTYLYGYNIVNKVFGCISGPIIRESPLNNSLSMPIHSPAYHGVQSCYYARGYMSSLKHHRGPKSSASYVKACVPTTGTGFQCDMNGARQAAIAAHK